MSIAVMIALQRTGTHALGSVIGQHPDVAYRDEIFSPSRANVPGGYFHFLADKLKTGPGIILPDKSVQRFNQYLKYVEESATKPINLLDVKYSSTHHFNTEWHPLTRAPTIIKQIPEPLEDVIVNFDELAAKLQPTIFAPMLFENDASR